MKKLNQKGLSLVEVMIVMGIISLVLVTSFFVFQQFFNDESFRQSVHTMAAEFSDVINDPKTGVFPEIDEVKCEESGGLIQFSVDPNATPGENNDCIILGKAVQLGITPPMGSEKINELTKSYGIYTLIGLASENESSADKFQVLKNTGTPPVFDTFVEKTVFQGASISKVFTYDDLNTNGVKDDTEPVTAYLDGFAILITNFGENLSANKVQFSGGSRNISLRALYNNADKVKSDRARLTKAVFESNTKMHDTISFYQEVDSPIIVCLDSGIKGVAYVQIGSAGGSLTTLEVLDETKAKAACR